MSVRIVADHGTDREVVIQNASSLDSGVTWAEGYTTATGSTVHVIDRKDGHPTGTYVVRDGRVRYEESTTEKAGVS